MYYYGVTCKNPGLYYYSVTIRPASKTVYVKILIHNFTYIVE